MKLKLDIEGKDWFKKFGFDSHQHTVNNILKNIV